MKGKAGCKDELKILSSGPDRSADLPEKDREGHQQWKQEGRKQEGIGWRAWQPWRRARSAKKLVAGPPKKKAKKERGGRKN